MAKKPGRGKGKHPIRPLRGTDGRFLPQGTDPPELPSLAAVGSPPPPEDDDDGPPVTARGILMLEPTSRVEIDLVATSRELEPGASGESERSTPPRRSPTPPLSSTRPRSDRQPVTETPRIRVAPITVETTTDESARQPRRPRGGFTFAAASHSHHPGPSAGYTDNRFDRFRAAWSEPEVPAKNTRGTDGEDEAAIVAELLGSNGYSNVTVARTRSRHDTDSAERAMHSHADRAEQYTRDAFDSNRGALALLRRSMEQAQQARSEASRARERYDEILSISSRHREQIRANRRDVTICR